MKPGFKSTEFYLVLLATLLGGFLAAGAVPDTGAVGQGAGAIVMALAAAGYSSVRAWVKNTSGTPGYKSTEFWLSIAAVVVGGLLTAGVFTETSLTTKILGSIASVLGAMGYSVSRSWVKIPPAAPPAPPEPSPEPADKLL